MCGTNVKAKIKVFFYTINVKSMFVIKREEKSRK